MAWQDPTRPRNWPGPWVVQVQAQASNSLAPAHGVWLNLAHGIDGVSISRSGDQVQVRLPGDGAVRKFFRLSATSP